MRWMTGVVAALAVVVTAITGFAQDVAGPAAGYAERYEGDRAIRVAPRSVRELRTVLGLSRAVLSERVGAGRGPIDVVVSPEAFETIGDLGLEVEILIDDVQAMIDAERAEIERRRTQRDITWYENYHPLNEIMAYIDELVGDHPTLASSEVIGQSVQGRDIVAMRVTAPGNSSDRTQVVINGCQHAREWVSPATVLFLTEHLLTQYGQDQRVTDIMNRVEFVVMPMVNPDGYRYTWTNYRLWRKNRRNNGGGSYGVDLNRNWSYRWGGSGSSGSSSSDTYRGPSPFSEPETDAVGDYMRGLPRAAAHIDFHSFSQLILYPWGYTYSPPTEPDLSAFIGLSNDISQAISGVHGQYYVPQQASDLYIADGIMSDWSYSEGMWGLTIELRPASGSSYQFELPPDQIIPTGQENVAALLTLAEFVAFPIRFGFPSGAPGFVEAGEETELTARVTATRGDIQAGSIKLYSRVGSSGNFSETTMAFVGEDLYAADLPAANCNETIEWYIAAETTDGAASTYPAAGESGPAQSMALDLIASTTDDAEADNGWTVGASGDNATTGVWNRMNPQATDAQPEDDHTPGGTDCWITDGRAGSGVGTYDVDGGTTTLVSPAFDATGGIDEPIAVLSYWRWYSNDQGASPNADSMPVQVSFNNGGSWQTLEDVTENANAWVYREFVLNDFGTPGPNTRVRFRARDLGDGSIVEAGVDDLELRIFGCEYRPGDYNQDGSVDTLDVLDFLNDWAAEDPKADWNNDGVVNTLDFLAFLNDWNLG